MQKKYFFLSVSLIPLLVGLTGIIALLHSPYLGIEFESRNEKWYIKEISPGSPADGIENIVGSEVISIGNWIIEKYSLIKFWDEPIREEPLKQWYGAQRYFSEHIKSGTPISLTIKQKDGNQSRVTFIPAESRLMEVIKNIGANFLAAVISLLIAIFVVIKRPEDIRARLFFSFIFCFTLVIFTFVSWTNRDIALDINIFKGLAVVDVIGLFYSSFTFYHFTLVFPMKKKIAGNKIFLTTLYTIPVALLLFDTPSDSFLVPLGSIFMLLYMAGFFMGLAVMIATYIRLKSPEEKAQIKWVFWATLTVFLVMLLFSYIPMLTMNKNILSHYHYYFITLLIPLSIAFAITKYRLMDIDTLFDSTLIYTITLGVLAIADIGVISFFSNIKSESFQISEPVATVLSVWVVIFAYLPVRNTIKGGVKRVLKREVYDLNEVTMRLSSHLLSASDIPSVLKKTLEIINDTLHPKGGEAFLFDEIKGDALHLPVEDIKRLKAPKPLYDLKSYTKKLPGDYKGGVVVPIIGSTGALGYLLLKEKYSERLYSSEDLKLLNTIASQTGLAIENIRLREERERLSREIHDGVGGSLTNAILTIDALSKDAGDRGKIDKHLINLKRLVTDGLTDLRELLWVLEDDEYTLKEIVSHIKEKVKTIMNGRDIHYEIEADIENEGFIFSPKVRLNIIRIIQESLINVLKHAEAGIVHISINEKGGEVTIRIKDDGKGFDTSAPSNGYGLRNIKRRCEEIGARLDIISKPLHGTEIEINVGMN